MRSGPDSKSKSDQPKRDGAGAAVLESEDDYQFPTARGVLSAEEIEALLRPTLPQGALEEPPIAPESITPKQTENFSDAAAPEPYSPASQAQAARMAMALGKGTGIKAAISPSQFATVERSALVGMLHGKSSAVACLGMSESDIRVLVCLPPKLADAIIAKACGGSGATGRIGNGWTLSAIDCVLLEQLLEPIAEAVRPGLQLQTIETDMPFVANLLPVQYVKITEFAVEAAGLHSELAVIQGDWGEHGETETRAPEQSAPVTALATARLARLSVPLSRITALKAGSTLLLGLPPDQPVELLSGGRDGTPAYEGQMGRKGNKVAIKISKKKLTSWT